MLRLSFLLIFQKANIIIMLQYKILFAVAAFKKVWTLKDKI